MMPHGFTYAISPIDSGHIKKGKKYVVSKRKPSTRAIAGTFYITPERGRRRLFCLEHGCAHIKGRSWTIQEPKA